MGTCQKKTLPVDEIDLSKHINFKKENVYILKFVENNEAEIFLKLQKQNKTLDLKN
jgi:hypothetical protein